MNFNLKDGLGVEFIAYEDQTMKEMTRWRHLRCDAWRSIAHHAQ